MDQEKLIKDISAVDMDVNKYCSLIIADALIRDDVVRLVLTHPHIMVYYHCYYILDQATLKKPDLFYIYWDDFAQLLDHKNSYHRDIGMTLLANLTQVDEQSRFELLFDRFFAQLHDNKFLTAINCVQNSQKVLYSKPHLADRILPMLLNTDILTEYPLKQKELMKSYILAILDASFESLGKSKGVLEFISSCTTSISPKTKAAAKKMQKKFGLSL